MTAFIHHLAYDIRTGIRDRSQMLMIYLFPLFFYIMMGLLMVKINPDYKSYMIPGLIIFAAMTGAILSNPNALVSARESGVLRSYKINGVPAFNIVIISILGIVIHLAVVSAVILFTAGPIFGAATPVSGSVFYTIATFLALGFCMAAVGVLIGVISPNSRATILLGQVIYLPSIMLGGIMMPLSVLPDGMARFSMILPGTYAMEAFRGLVWGLPTMIDPQIAILVMIAGGLFALGLSLYLFNWDDKNTGKRRSPYLALLALLPYILGALFLA